MTEVTRILERIERGDAKAAEELLPLVYEQLRQLAAYKIASEAPDKFTRTLTLSLLSICLAVAIVALRQPRRVQRRNGSHGPLGLRKAFAPLDAALLVAARRVLPR